MTTGQPLAGMRVVDLSEEKGELCARMLADLGADVTRVEPPGGGPSRALPPLFGEVSLFFAYRNSNKRGVALDLGRAADRERLHTLLAAADVVVESARPGEREAVGLDGPGLARRHPHLIVTSITDFGQSGPYRDWIATDAVIEAMGGVLFKAGLPEREPLCPPVPIAYETAAAIATFATVLARVQQQQSGHGQHIDVSALEATAQSADWSFANAGFMTGLGQPYPELRAGSGPVYTIYPCKDGYVRLVVLSPRQWRAMRAWLGEPEAFLDEHWDGFIHRLVNADVINALYEAHFATMNRDEVSREAQRRGIVCTPVLRPEEVLANEHLRSRGTFLQAAQIAPGLEAPVAAGFFEIDGERQGFRQRAPTPGEHGETVFADAERSARPAPRGEVPEPRAPLAGVRVLDFGIGGVGVEASRLLAEYGADVIKVESRSYPDFIRVITGSEMSASFASSSRSKRGFGVDLKNPEGLAVLHRLIERADLVIENSSTGTMDALGVGRADIERINPRCSLVSSQLLGSRGAWADWIGYGPSTQPLGGLVHLWNYEDRDFPAGGGAIFPDHLVGRLVATIAVAALIGREHSGRGLHGEVAQIEAVTGLLGDLLMKAALDPGSVRARGNRSERGAPFGAYPCAGEQQWVVITCRDDDDWRRLCRVLGDPAWAADASLATAAGRARAGAHDRIDAELARFTATRDKFEVTRSLQAAGVPAGPMLTGAEMLEDPQLVARGFPRWCDQQDLGRICFEGPAFVATGMADVRIAQAPRLGEHTREVCESLLGMDPTAVDRLFASGALEQARERIV